MTETMTPEKEYVTLMEAATEAGVKRASVYNYLLDLNIQTHKFGRDRKAYITREDAERLKMYKQEPWKVKVETRGDKPKNVNTG